ncbi:MAG: TrkH family potassium uptake protein [Puniceicoccaceae bacterium]
MKGFFGKTVSAIGRFLNRHTPVQTIVFGYATYILVIFLPLALLPATSVPGIGLLDHLFMATSAVSTTGLSTLNLPESYNLLGQVILLLGFQIGGLGYMTFGSFAIMASRGQVSESRIKIGRAVFAMPDHFDPISFIRRAVVFSLLVEVFGTIALYFAFSRAGVESPLWPALFHSVSAFCTAGLSTFPNSLEGFQSNFLIIGIISLLSILGALGFIVISDLWLASQSRIRKITLTSKIILVATFGGITLGALAITFDPSVSDAGYGKGLPVAIFQAISALTTVGFNTVPVGLLSQASIMVIIVLMILGASPSGTGGGLKSTSWSAGLAATWSMIRGRKETTFFGNVVPNHRIQAAFGSFTLYMMFFSLGCYLLLLADRHHFEDIVFEVASALGTVGLSRGITTELTVLGKVTVMGLMFIGRIGVVSLALAALARRHDNEPEIRREEDLII